MLRHMDAQSPEVGRLQALAVSPRTDAALATEYLDAWLDYLPRVYPVAILLNAAALTDGDARAAIDDRLVGALLSGFTRFFTRLAETGRLRAGVDPAQAALEIWAGVHPFAWRLLVVERHWTAEQFRQSRQAAMQALLLVRAPLGAIHEHAGERVDQRHRARPVNPRIMDSFHSEQRT
jgi:hypothetical protein